MMLKWSHGTDLINMGQINYYFLQCILCICTCSLGHHRPLIDRALSDGPNMEAFAARISFLMAPRCMW